MDRPQSHLTEATRPHLWLNALDARTALWCAPNDIQGIGTAHCCHRRYHPTRAARCDPAQSRDRKSVEEGKSVSGRVDLGVRRRINKKNLQTYNKKTT